MQDTLQITQQLFARRCQPIASTLSLHTLPPYVHEVLFSLHFFHIFYKQISPRLSPRLSPLVQQTYSSLSHAARADWNLHVVSLIQSTILSIFSSYLRISQRHERSQRRWVERVYGYGEDEALLLSFAWGYFAWHFAAMVVHVRRHGWSMVAHVVCGFAVFSTGYVSPHPDPLWSEPSIVHGGVGLFCLLRISTERCSKTETPRIPHIPVFLLYELPNVFLNFYRFFNKLGMGSSVPALINAVVLVPTFSVVRLVWGFYQTFWFYKDMWTGYITIRQ
jgi:hypothetical protein